jgi:hypothetical protein
MIIAAPLGAQMSISAQSVGVDSASVIPVTYYTAARRREATGDCSLAASVAITAASGRAAINRVWRLNILFSESSRSERNQLPNSGTDFGKHSANGIAKSWCGRFHRSRGIFRRGKLQWRLHLPQKYVATVFDVGYPISLRRVLFPFH